MTGLLDIPSRLRGLSLRSRLHVALAVALLPLLAVLLLGGALQLVASAAMEDWLERAHRAATLADVSLATAGAAAGTPPPALHPPLRQHMRDITALSRDPVVGGAARGVNLLLMDLERGQAVPAATLLSAVRRVADAAAEAAARQRSTVARLAWAAQLTLMLAPVLAAAGGWWMARRINRSIDLTLRECIAFAGEIANDNFRHGGGHARPAARARVMAQDPDSAGELGALVRAMNRIAEETRIAAERDAEQGARLVMLERSWALLSACSQSLVHAVDETALLQQICSHLVEWGGYRAAWVGYARDDAQMSIAPVAHAGADQDYVAELRLSWGGDVHRQGGFGAAIHQRRRMVCNNLSGDLVFHSWRNIAPPHGLARCAALPLLDGEHALGVLGIHGGDWHPFAEVELKLLQDLSEQLVFGVISRRQTMQRQQAQASLAHHARFDSLTGLANMGTLERELAGACASGQLTLLHVNLDRFREINQTLGRHTGDQVLVEVAQRLARVAGPDAFLARSGGDEFWVLVRGAGGNSQGAALAGRICAALAEPLACVLAGAGPLLRPVASIGISIGPDNGMDAAAMLGSATLAMQDAKGQGGNTHCFYAAGAKTRVAARFVMEAELGGALAREEMFMHYQPQCSLLNGAIVGAEALLRWRHPVRGIVSPGEFIRVAEESGLFLPIGAWTINHVCAQLAAWRTAGLAIPTVSVNLSPRQFGQPDLVQTVQRALTEHGVPGPALALEVTESAMMRDIDAAVATMRALKELGVRMVLADFGTGHASLNHLKRLLIDCLKIDQSFVRDVATAPDDAMICNTIIGLAHSLHVSVVAEGVETGEQMAFLKRRQCDAMQGFLFSKAVAADAFARLVSARKCLPMPPVQQAQTTVLLLDDEADILRALNRTLRQDGYKILAATSITDALQLLALNEVHVVVSDQRMPAGTGTEFLAKVKLLYPDTMRILLTGYADMQSVIDAINQGAVSRYFTKPWENDELRACVAQAARQRDAAAVAG